MHASVGLDVNVTLLVWFCVTYLLLEGRDTSRQTVWLGWHAAEKIWVLEIFLCPLYISGAPRLAQSGQKSDVECKGKSQPDWDSNVTSLRNESLA